MQGSIAIATIIALSRASGPCGFTGLPLGDHDGLQHLGSCQRTHAAGDRVDFVDDGDWLVQRSEQMVFVNFSLLSFRARTAHQGPALEFPRGRRRARKTRDAEGAHNLFVCPANEAQWRPRMGCAGKR